MLTWFKTAPKPKPCPPVPAEPQPFAVNSVPALAEGSQLAAPGKSRRVLVVDDDAVVLKAFEIKLQGSGFTVFTATDPATVAGTAQKIKPEIILLDVNFPPAVTSMEWSGLTALQWLRRFPELAAIPVIVVSGGGGAACKNKALAAGAKAYFQKPVVYKELLGAMLAALDMPKA
jgi:CheY-like chemotaxis protein